jgi:hypothetical protein
MLPAKRYSALDGGRATDCKLRLLTAPGTGRRDIFRLLPDENPANAPLNKAACFTAELDLYKLRLENH